MGVRTTEIKPKQRTVTELIKLRERQRELAAEPFQEKVPIVPRVKNVQKMRNHAKIQNRAGLTQQRAKVTRSSAAVQELPLNLSLKELSFSSKPIRRNVKDKKKYKGKRNGPLRSSIRLMVQQQQQRKRELQLEMKRKAKPRFEPTMRTVELVNSADIFTGDAMTKILYLGALGIFPKNEADVAAMRSRVQTYEASMKLAMKPVKRKMAAKTSLTIAKRVAAIPSVMNQTTLSKALVRKKALEPSSRFMSQGQSQVSQEYPLTNTREGWKAVARNRTQPTHMERFNDTIISAATIAATSSQVLCPPVMTPRSVPTTPEESPSSSRRKAATPKKRVSRLCKPEETTLPNPIVDTIDLISSDDEESNSSMLIPEACLQEDQGRCIVPRSPSFHRFINEVNGGGRKPFGAHNVEDPDTQFSPSRNIMTQDISTGSQIDSQRLEEIKAHLALLQTTVKLANVE